LKAAQHLDDLDRRLGLRTEVASIRMVDLSGARNVIGDVQLARRLTKSPPEAFVRDEPLLALGPGDSRVSWRAGSAG